MADYRTMYYVLFNAITKIIGQMQLVQGQTEDIFLDTSSPKIFKISDFIEELTNMEIRDIKVRKFYTDAGSLLGLVSFTYGAMAVHDAKIIQREDGSRFVAMPNRQEKNGIRRDIVHPLNATLRDQVNTLILDAYDKELKKQTQEDDNLSDDAV